VVVSFCILCASLSNKAARHKCADCFEIFIFDPLCRVLRCNIVPNQLLVDMFLGTHMSLMLPDNEAGDLIIATNSMEQSP
jgi:hypothetical protein